MHRQGGTPVSREIKIQVTDEAYMFLEARVRQTSGGLTVEEYAKSAIAQHMYASLALEKKFDAARAAVSLLDV